MTTDVMYEYVHTGYLRHLTKKRKRQEIHLYEQKQTRRRRKKTAAAVAAAGPGSSRIVVPADRSTALVVLAAGGGTATLLPGAVGCIAINSSLAGAEAQATGSEL